VVGRNDTGVVRGSNGRDHDRSNDRDEDGDRRLLRLKLTYASDVCHSVARRLSRMLLILLDSAMIDDDFDHDVYHDDDEAV
jgi:hypothetical protein